MNLFERTKLQPREQQMATMAVFVLAAFVLLGIPVGLSMLVSSRTEANKELADVLHEVNQSRAKIKERQEKKRSIGERYAKKTPQLGGFIETTAATAKVAIADSVDRPDTAHGKQYNERQTTVHLKNSGLGPIVKFLELLEQSNYPVSVTRLNIRKRSAEPDSYGPIEVAVSAYDRTAPASTSASSPAGSSSASPSKTK